MHVSDSFCFHHFIFFGFAIQQTQEEEPLGSAWQTGGLGPHGFDTGMVMRILHDKVLVEGGGVGVVHTLSPLSCRRPKKPMVGVPITPLALL
jgi:hypothetical protein